MNRPRKIGLGAFLLLVSYLGLSGLVYVGDAKSRLQQSIMVFTLLLIITAFVAGIGFLLSGYSQDDE